VFKIQYDEKLIQENQATLKGATIWSTLTEVDGSIKVLKVRAKYVVVGILFFYKNQLPLSVFYFIIYLLALSPQLYSSITFEPPLPLAKSNIASKMPIGSVIKVYLHYDKPYWRLKGFDGNCVDSVGPCSNTMDTTLAFKENADANSVKDYCIMGLILGDNARRIAHLSKDEVMLTVS
jgi:hypothetical protein